MAGEEEDRLLAVAEEAGAVADHQTLPVAGEGVEEVADRRILPVVVVGLAVEVEPHCLEEVPEHGWSLPGLAEWGAWWAIPLPS